MAIADFTQALALMPDDVFTYNKRGLAYEKAGLPEQAIKDYRKAFQLNPNDKDAKNALRRLGVSP